MATYLAANRDPTTPFANTLNPTMTGSTALALAYDGGVAVVTDRTMFYGKLARLENNTRQYRLNNYCLITYSGDAADFQWLQNFLEREQAKLQSKVGTMTMWPRMVTSRLTSFFYNRRSKMDPVWLTVIVSGMQPVEFESGKFEPYIGVVQKRGDCYETKYVATELGAMLLNQMLENRVREAPNETLTKEIALEVLKKCMEMCIYRSVRSGKTFDVSTVDAKDGVQFQDPVTIAGDWSLVEVCAGEYH